MPEPEADGETMMAETRTAKAATLDHLRRAFDALPARPKVALSHSLEAWRGWRSESIARAVEGIGIVAARSQPTLLRNPSESLQKAWLRRAALNDPADATLLLKTVTDATRKLAAKRVAAFATVPPDPRIGRVLALAFTHLKIGHSGRPFLDAALTVIEAHGDPTLAEVLEAVAGQTRLLAIRALLRQTASTLPGPPPEDRALDQWAEQIQNAAAAMPEDQRPAALETLRQQIFAAPKEIEHRLIYADLLSEIGDPHGEFITLQLSRPADARPSPRERELQRNHSGDWLGALAPILQKGGLEFAGGFPVAGRLKEAGRPKIDHLEWATFRQLNIGTAYQWPVEVLALPQLQHLEALQELTLRQLSQVIKQGHPLPIHTISCGRWCRMPETFRLLKQLDAPRLHIVDLRLADPPDLAHVQQFMSSPLAQRLDSLAFTVRSWEDAEPMSERVFQKSPGLKRLELQLRPINVPGPSMILVRSVVGLNVTLAQRPAKRSPRALDIVAIVPWVPNATTVLRIDLGPKRRDSKQLEQLSAALELRGWTLQDVLQSPLN